MKHSFIPLALFSTLCLSYSAFAGHKTIYGNDGRQEISDFVGSLLRSKAQSVAGMVAKTKLLAVEGGYTFQAENLTKFGMCSSVNFSAQNLLPDCTGFMVGDDLLMTAGHCIEKYADCADYTWVFNYDAQAAAQQFIPEMNRVDCKRIVKREYHPEDGVDYAIIQLNQSQSSALRPPLAVANEEFKVGTHVAMIGHPSSLPLKITTGGVTVKELGNSVRVTLDAFGGNSGSPVFDRQTGELLGMLTGGGTDFIEKNGCKVEYKCAVTGSGDECGGEDVFKVSRANISQILASSTDETLLSEAVVAGDSDLVDFFLSQNEDINRAVFGWTPLMQAVLSQNIGLVQKLIDAGADLNLTENFDNGNSLIIAISLGNEEIADLLLSNGAFLDQVTSAQNETALTMAIQKEMLELAEKLIEAGARSDIKTKDGYTAKDFADFIGSSELLDLLESTEE